MEQNKKLNITRIDTIKAIGITLYRVVFENAFLANECLKKHIQHNSRAILLKRSHIPIEYSDKEIKQNISSVVKIMFVERLTNKDR